MISFINSMQIILNLPLLKGNFPSNAVIACRLILAFVSFDILEDNEVYQRIVQPYETDHEVVNIRD